MAMSFDERMTRTRQAEQLQEYRLNEVKHLFRDARGGYKTQSLFHEMNQTNDNPVFTTKEHDIIRDDGLYIFSLKRLYTSIEDPTEYSHAMSILGSWDHWQRLCNNAVIGRLLNEARVELEVKIRSKAIRAMISTAEYEGSKGTGAAKYIAEKGWEGSKRGRPSKEEVEGRLKQDMAVTDSIRSDAERLGIKLN